jgi:type II secretory pathway pseudopilin PulG
MNHLKSNRLASQSGTTLIELSVVIAVIILLATVLFMGVAAWKKGANQAASIVIITSVQKAVRGAENMFGYAQGSTYAIGAAGTPGTLVGDGFFANAPIDPITNTAFVAVGGGKIPAPGAMYLTPDTSIANRFGTAPLTPPATIDISSW